MKLKRILAGILTGAMMITGIPAFGMESAAAVSVYADQNGLEAVGSTEYSNVALEKAVKTSGVSGEEGITGAAAVDGNTNTKWVSADLRKVSPQWIQIDLGEKTTSVDRIEIVYADAVWDQPYEIQTYDSEKNTHRDTVRNIGAAGPSGGTAEEPENRDADTKTDTVRRDADNKKIILKRYVNILFSTPGSGTNEKRVSISEIRIFGRETRTIFGPKVKMTAPVNGEYPKIAEVLASEDHEAVYHETLADRATPAASFMRTNYKTTADQTQNREIGEAGQTQTVSAPLWNYTDENAVGALSDTDDNKEIFVKDGVMGFNVHAHTPGTINKFDAWGNDVVIVSCQFYLDQFIGQRQAHLFAKGNKYSCKLYNNQLMAELHSAGNTWPNVKYTFNNDDLDQWHDVLLVIDGHGYMRLYVDGERGTEIASSASGQATLNRGEPAGGFKPFSLCYSEGGDTVNGDAASFDRNKNFLNKDDGYIARLKFYTNKDNNGLMNGAGTDITEAKTLSEGFVEALDIQAMESKNGADNVGKIITNMLQKEEPTSRITLCPYSRSTVWSKKGGGADANWEEMAAAETFSDSVKYKATTVLKADDGFAFASSSVDNILASLETGDSSGAATSTVKLSDRERVLTIITYYNCTENDVEDTCHIDDLSFANDPIQMTVGETVSVGAEAVGIGKCGKHTSATVKYEYSLPDDETRVTLDQEKGELTAVSSTKGIIGYDPVLLTVTAVLKDGDETVQAGNEDVKVTKTIEVHVDPEQSADQVIDKAPMITAQAPLQGNYPEVVDIAISGEAKHFEDVADRMNPSATLEPLTEDYIRNEPSIKVGTDSKGDKKDPNPNDAWINAWKADKKYEPVVENVDGVWAFNAVGQTPGDTNKFDVFGRDIKLVSFKLYLKKWPENPYKSDVNYNENEMGGDYANDGTTVDIYGKGNKYAFQVASSKKLIMYMNAGADRGDKSAWPQQTFEPEDPDAFLNTWHDVFMVVDGKGWQRLYVDGKRSRSRGALKQDAAGNYTILDETKDKNAQGGAFAAETTEANKKPFTLGYNSLANHPSWYDGIFDSSYGYIADFEFYSDKNYDNIINGAGTNISDAKILSEKFVKKIDLAKLETDHADNLDDIGTILTNMLQESNATAMLTASPYVTKTNWYQETDETGDDVEDGFKKLDKVGTDTKGPDKFDYATSYQVQVEMTAFDGFKFANTAKFKKDVENQFKTEGETQAQQVIATVESNAAGEADKVLKIKATYGRIPAPCTCGIASVSPQDPISVTIPEDAETATVDITQIPESAVTLVECRKENHPITENKKITFKYDVAEEDRDKIELIFDSDGVISGVKAKKVGTATINVKVEYQISGVTVENDEHEKAEYIVPITVSVRKAGAAAPEDREALDKAADKAIEDYPEDLKDDYLLDAWEELQNAIQNAKDVAANEDARPEDVSNAQKRLSDAISDLANKKSEKGQAKDALDQALSIAKKLYDTNNADKTYTDASWKIFTEAYEKAVNEKATAADAAALKNLMSALKTAQDGLVKRVTDTGTIVGDGTELTGADGTKYQVVSGKDMTVIITKGVDAKTIKVGPAVTIGKDTFRVVGIGNSAYTGLKKATKVIINANVVSIADQAFAKSKKIKNVTIGANVTTIGKKAFFNCPKLNKVILKGTGLTNKSIGKQAFKKTAKKVTVKWGKVKGKQRNQLKKALKKAGMKVK